jgi:hypothetical protein
VRIFIAPLPVVMSNQCAVMHFFVHLTICAQVLVASCVAVFAVTVPWQRARRHDPVDEPRNERDLPMPWPEAIASRIGATAFRPSKPRSRTFSPSSSRNSHAHLSGPYLHP